MKMMIDIPDGYVKALRSGQKAPGSIMDKVIRQAIIDGTPIPKELGRTAAAPKMKSSNNYMLIEALAELYNFNPKKKIGSEIVFEIVDPDDAGTEYEGAFLRIGKHWSKIDHDWMYFEHERHGPGLGCEEKHFVSNFMTTTFAKRCMHYAAQQGTYVIRKIVDTRL